MICHQPNFIEDKGPIEESHRNSVVLFDIPEGYILPNTSVIATMYLSTYLPRFQKIVCCAPAELLVWKGMNEDISVFVPPNGPFVDMEEDTYTKDIRFGDTKFHIEIKKIKDD
jgi:hypothetical protein